MHCSVSRAPAHPPAASSVRSSSRITWKCFGPSPGVTSRPQRVIRIHPLARRRTRQQLQEDFQVLKCGNSPFDPDIKLTSHLRHRQAHPAPLPSDSTTHTAPVSAIAKFGGATDADLSPAENARADRSAPHRSRSVGSSVSPSGQIHRFAEQVANLKPVPCAAPGTIMCEGSSSPICTIMSARSVSYRTNFRRALQRDVHLAPRRRSSS